MDASSENLSGWATKPRKVAQRPATEVKQAFSIHPPNEGVRRLLARHQPHAPTKLPRYQPRPIKQLSTVAKFSSFRS